MRISFKTDDFAKNLSFWLRSSFPKRCSVAPISISVLGVCCGPQTPKARKVSGIGFHPPEVYAPRLVGSQILVLRLPHFLHAPTQNSKDLEKSTRPDSCNPFPESSLTASAPVSGVSAPVGTNGVWLPLRPVSVAQNIPSTMLSSNVHSIDLLMDCTAWWFWTMRQSNGCSTPSMRSSAAKQWLEQLAQKFLFWYGFDTNKRGRR